MLLVKVTTNHTPPTPTHTGKWESEEGMAPRKTAGTALRCKRRSEAAMAQTPRSWTKKVDNTNQIVRGKQTWIIGRHQPGSDAWENSSVRLSKHQRAHSTSTKHSRKRVCAIIKPPRYSEQASLTGAVTRKETTLMGGRRGNERKLGNYWSSKKESGAKSVH